MTRREALVLAAAVGCVALSCVADAHDRIGVLDPPQALPAMQVTPLRGGTGRLDDLMRGRVSAVQLMFTGCSATCPIAGALFATLQARLAAAPPRLRLLSISIDPLGDNPASLQRWLERFGAQDDRWTGVLPTATDVDRLLEFVDGRRGGVDRHATQIYLFDTQARLCYRTAPMPQPASVVTLMRAISARD